MAIGVTQAGFGASSKIPLPWYARFWMSVSVRAFGCGKFSEPSIEFCAVGLTGAGTVVAMPSATATGWVSFKGDIETLKRPNRGGNVQRLWGVLGVVDLRSKGERGKALFFS